MKNVLKKSKKVKKSIKFSSFTDNIFENNNISGEKNEILKIQDEITRTTYKYFCNTDNIFKSYIYGDIYYRTLNEIIYKMIISFGLDCKVVKSIDIIELVSVLYEVFIRADIFYQDKYEFENNFRHRKNYIHKSLRRATVSFVTVALQIFVSNLNDEAENLKKFRYLSLDRDGEFIENISFKLWEKEKSEISDREGKKEKIRQMTDILNDVEKEVITLCLEGRDYDYISEEMKISKDNIKKIFYRAKNKLVKNL